MTLEVNTQLQFTAEGYQLHWTPQLTALMKVQKLWRLIQAGLNQDLADQTLLFQTLVMTHIIKHSLLHSQIKFHPVY